MRKVKIIGIVGSPRQGGNNEIMVKETLRGAKKAGAQVELVHLGKVKVEWCDGCLSCEEGRCPIQDDMAWINKKLVEAHGYIFGTPARWNLLSAQLKLLIERMSPIAPDETRGKKAIVLGVGQLSKKDKDSIEKAVESVKFFLEPAEIEVIGEVVAFGARDPGEIKKQSRVLKKCFELGKKLTRAVNK